MRNIVRAALAVGGALLYGAIACGAGFQIEVQVKAADRQVATERTEETTAKPSEANRPSLTLKAGEAARVSWVAKNLDERAEVKDVLVHFFVVREKQPGQRAVPRLDESVTYEGALTTDLKPQEKADWHFDLTIDTPGSYLVRVETVGMAETHGHDHFAALDLVVE